MSALDNEQQARTVIRCPHIRRITDTVRDILHLKAPQPLGFAPTGKHTFVETIVDAEGDGIGPLSVSSALNRLFCYAVRYDDGKFGTMLITGDSFARAFTSGAIHDGLSSLNRATLLHGSIVQHSLVVVKTPPTCSDETSAFYLTLEKTRLHEDILRQEPANLSELPPLGLYSVALANWSSCPTIAPTCAFETRMNSSFWLTITWGKSYDSMRYFRLL